MSNILETSIVDVIERYKLLFLKEKNVVGVGLSNKKIKGVNTKEPTLTFLVEKKIPINKLYSYELLPKNFLGIKTDVCEIGNFNMFNSDNTVQVEENINFLSYKRPIEAGYNIGAYNPNFVDCAIAKILPNIKYNTQIYNVGKVQGYTDAKNDMPIKKVGTLTGYTQGVVDVIQTAFYLEMFEDTYCLFEKQIIANLNVSAGDSGALVLNDKNEAIGLLIGGSQLGKAYITPIETVLKYLNVHL